MSQAVGLSVITDSRETLTPDVERGELGVSVFVSSG